MSNTGATRAEKKAFQKGFTTLIRRETDLKFSQAKQLADYVRPFAFAAYVENKETAERKKDTAQEVLLEDRIMLSTLKAHDIHFDDAITLGKVIADEIVNVPSDKLNAVLADMLGQGGEITKEKAATFKESPKKNTVVEHSPIPMNTDNGLPEGFTPYLGNRGGSPFYNDTNSADPLTAMSHAASIVGAKLDNSSDFNTLLQKGSTVTWDPVPLKGQKNQL